eukprot:2947673-Prymnesium_polylepis.1
MRKYGNLWRFLTRAVEGRGGRLKHIGSRMICWRSARTVSKSGSCGARSSSRRTPTQRAGGGS